MSDYLTYTYKCDYCLNKTNKTNSCKNCGYDFCNKCIDFFSCNCIGYYCKNCKKKSRDNKYIKYINWKKNEKSCDECLKKKCLYCF